MVEERESEGTQPVDGVLSRKLSRRKLLKAGAALGLGAASLTYLSACGSENAPASTTATAAPGGSSGSTAPLRLVGWEYHPEIVEDNVKKFNELNKENAQYQLQPGWDYPDVMEARFIGGDIPDVIYCETDHLDRWYKAGWIEPLDDLPGFKDELADLYPVVKQDNVMSDGKTYGMPYYSAWLCMVYNSEILDKAGFKPAQTGDELLSQCREMKAKDLVKYPMLDLWTTIYWSLSWNLFTQCYGEGDPVFDKDFNPTWTQGGTGFKNVLTRWKTMFDEKLVPADILTMGNTTTLMGQGDGAYYVASEFFIRDVLDPKTTKVQDKIMMMPVIGSAHKTRFWNSWYVMGKNKNDKARKWNLMKHFSGKGSNGQYNVGRRWALDAGLRSGHIGIEQDPEVTKYLDSIYKPKDVVEKNRGEYAQLRSVEHTLWFSQWDKQLATNVQSYIQGTVKLDDLLKTLGDLAVDLKKRYTT